MAHFPATNTVNGIITAADQVALASSKRDFLETIIQSTPNDVVRLHGDGGANARGINFGTSRNMLRLRISFKVDAGNNHDLRVRLMKYNDNDSTSYELARATRSDMVDGNPGNNTYHAMQQLVSAGANPSQSDVIANVDFLYFIIDKAAGTVATGISQLTIAAEHEAL